ncbi:acetolactate synthase-1/2/3 large subunit [Angulomicrobium tetraedrale]|uniref:Acetolactate synthase-1/2/3 large subunit n=1 Tax=Ancylobacter tetraedralis TaxID=217068 RepID=A0A839ZBQ7_9HYPH|nr:5-guanidino-2-oxopentanoate decarboxylase [Ancylobacter tetraedralis]MBB3772184.1 acetolactate synthase-1/2/3 large subunit [Ancylobacter tetraedralis]
MKSAGIYLSQLLEIYGVDTVFGIPGVHTVELYRGLAGSSIRHVTPRHEQGAGFMADGYARVTGRPGVCFIITGPGMTNILTAMGQAYGDSVAMLVISTVNAHGRMGSGEGWLHELPQQQALVSGVCAFSRTLHTVEEIAPALAQAFAVFGGERPRPVHLELPIDVMLASADHLPLPAAVSRLARPSPNAASLDEAARWLTAARTPLILAGGGAARAAVEVRALAERIDAPVAMTINARGILPPEHPLGVHLTASLRATRELIAEADVVLALGTEFGSTDYDFNVDGGFAIPGQLIRVDIDPRQIMRTILPQLGIVGDAGAAARALAALIPPRPRGAGAARAEAVKARYIRDIAPDMRGDLLLLDTVREALPGAIIVGDSTQLVYAGNIAFVAETPSSWFNSATGYGTLGYGLPAGIGAKIAAPDRPVVVLSGDGGLQFTLAELASAVEAQAPIILLLHDNGGYGEIKFYMTAAQVAPLGVDLVNPDFLAVGAAFGWAAQRIHDPDHLAPALLAAAARTRPTLILFGDDLRQIARERAPASG